MPYISKENRERIRSGAVPVNAGELNFCITELVLEYLGNSPCYQDFNDVLGALEGAKFEVYRRSCAPYEDSKIEQNGDLFYPYSEG